MQLGATTVVESHAEAFAARCARLIVSAADQHWLDAALEALCGYGTSLIGCDAEVGVEQRLDADRAPDGRPAAAVLVFAFSLDKLARAVANRVGQTLLTCPTAAVFDGLPDSSDRLPLGDHLRYFGDGHERRDGDQWVVPIMEGDLTLPTTVGTTRGVAGGNLLLLGADQDSALAAARRAAEAVRGLPGVITPFPGGVCRSGSKVGSRYRGLVASTNEAFCPSLNKSSSSQLPPRVRCVYELILNGVDESSVRSAMATAAKAAAGNDLIAISAGSYGGKLGKVRIPLHELFST